MVVTQSYLNALAGMFLNMYTDIKYGAAFGKGGHGESRGTANQSIYF